MYLTQFPSDRGRIPYPSSFGKHVPLPSLLPSLNFSAGWRERVLTQFPKEGSWLHQALPGEDWQWAYTDSVSSPFRSLPPHLPLR
jgi:hypothetical protein